MSIIKPFTNVAHNIKLGKYSESNPKIKLTANTSLWKSAKKAIKYHLFQNPDSKAIDLGCLEGGHSVELARMGFDTIGLEARTENIVNCKNLLNYLRGLPLMFVQDDARNILDYGKFDVVFCAGLLYHLDDPISMINRMYNTTNNGGICIINTHYAPEYSLRYQLGWLNNKIIAPIQKRFNILNYRHNYRLSPLTTNEGYRGRWYKEYNSRANKNSIENAKLSAYNNNRSFWLCKDELVRALKDVGFKLVYEQPDFSEDMGIGYKEYYHRCMLVALK